LEQGIDLSFSARNCDYFGSKIDSIQARKIP